MPENSAHRRFVFPKWANFVVPAALVAFLLGLPYQVLLAGLGLNPTTLNVGYQPEQPIPYSHELHVYELGMDCRYCHTTVEDADFAAIPSSDICMNCHHAIRRNSTELEPLYASFRTGKPIPWKKVHDLGDYAYFNHAAHVNKGVSCVSCHGRVDRMGEEGVYQHESLSMGWCLVCHRNPTPYLRPLDQVANLGWGMNMSEQEVAQLAQMGVEGLEVGDTLSSEQRLAVGRIMRDELDIPGRRRMQDCSTCHR